MVLSLLSGVAFGYTADPSVMNAIKNNQIVDYNPTKKIWSRNLGLNDFVFKKQITVGTGGYSEYFLKDKQYDINSTYEFLYYGKLIAYNAHLLKFFELTFENNDFVSRELSKEEVQYLFPDVEIILVSEFKNNEITIESPIFRRRAYMILNDTDRDFYKYQFEYYKPSNNIFKGIFETSYPRILIYSHFKSRDDLFPILKINIKPVLKGKGLPEENNIESTQDEETETVEDN